MNCFSCFSYAVGKCQGDLNNILCDDYKNFHGELTKKVEEFISSEEGKKIIAEALNKADELNKKLAEERRIRPEDWTRPMTI